MGDGTIANGKMGQWGMGQRGNGRWDLTPDCRQPAHHVPPQEVAGAVAYFLSNMIELMPVRVAANTPTSSVCCVSLDDRSCLNVAREVKCNDLFQRWKACMKSIPWNLHGTPAGCNSHAQPHVFGMRFTFTMSYAVQHWLHGLDQHVPSLCKT